MTTKIEAQVNYEKELDEIVVDYNGAVDAAQRAGTLVNDIESIRQVRTEREAQAKMKYDEALETAD